MRILAIETSCDETGAAVIEVKEGKVRLLKNTVATSLVLHKKTGGIIPENAAREQIKYIIPVINETIEPAKGPTSTRLGEAGEARQGRQSNNGTMNGINAIAVTVGPGLIGSLLVGVETAKTLSFVFDKPLIPVNHLIGHIYANWIDQKSEIEFPAIALVVSGGHTDLLLMKGHGNIKWLGGTRDDAAGEAFDKIGRLLDLPYPGGPTIEKRADGGNPKVFSLPRPMIDSSDFDFSFSGLKTAVLREIQTMEQLNNEAVSDICASVQEAIIDVLVAKTLKAAKKYKVKSILLGGGVAANQKLRDELNSALITHNLGLKLFVPEKFLCTDNAAMIASAAYFNPDPLPWQKVEAQPELYL